MFHLFSGQTANDIWSQAADALLTGKKHLTASRSGNTIELLHTFIHIQNPIQRWVTQRVPPISIGFALAELIWILAGSNDANTINYWNPGLPKFSGDGSKYHGAYGYRIKRNFGFDQLERAYITLKNNPSSRQSVILIWDPQKDVPDKLGIAINKDIPCNICSLLKVRNNRLEWTQVMRSNDLFLGLPYNLVQFTSIQEILAGWLGIDVGSYCHYSDSLHLYCHDFHNIDILGDDKILNNDSLLINKTECCMNIENIYHNMEIMASNDVTEGELYELSKLNTVNVAYRNIMCIIALYAANKKGYQSLAQTLQNRCSNNLYIFLWKRWKERNTNDEKN